MRALKTTLFLSLFALLAFGAEEKAPATVSKDGTGEAAIINNNEPKAFEDAKKAALRNALEQVAGVYLQADTVTKNSQLVLDRVVAKSDGYVKKFDVISKKVDKGVMSVTVRAEIGTAQLEKDVVATRGIVDRLGRSKIIIVVQENSIDDKGVTSRSEILPTELTKIFKNDGWTIIDEKGTGEDKLTVHSGVAQGKLDPKEVGKKSDADYIVYGSVNLRYLPPRSGQVLPEVDGNGNQLFFFVTGDYDLSMLETRTGRQLAKIAGKLELPSMKKVETKISYSRSALDFCRVESPRIVSELRSAAIETLRDQDVNGMPVTMQISNVPDLDAVDDLEKSLATISGVRGVKMSGDYKDGKVEFEVGFLGSSRELGRALGSTTYKKKKLVVTTVQNNRLEVAIAK
jgi:hypothetical protein